MCVEPNTPLCCVWSVQGEKSVFDDVRRAMIINNDGNDDVINEY